MAEPAQIGAIPSALMAQAAPPWPPIALRGVLEAAVVAQPDPTSGEIAVALAAESPLGREEIGASVKPRLGIKTPRAHRNHAGPGEDRQRQGRREAAARAAHHGRRPLMAACDDIAGGAVARTPFGRFLLEVWD